MDPVYIIGIIFYIYIGILITIISIKLVAEETKKDWSNFLPLTVFIFPLWPIILIVMISKTKINRVYLFP